MFPSTYHFRICVEENSQVLPFNIYTTKDMKPMFDELVNKIQKHINLKHYSLVTNSKHIIYDDKSLHSALTSASGDLEIILEDKNLPQGGSLYKYKLTDQVEISNDDIIPKITTEYSNESNRDNSNTCRKDSGIFFDDYAMKKGKFCMIDHPRKLPYPSSPSLAYHYNTHLIDSKMIDPSPSISSSSSSTCSESSLYRTPIKLPAITTITGSRIEKQDTQLAPIHSLSVPVSKRRRRQNSIKSSTDVHICNFRGESEKVCGLSFRRPYDLSRHKTTHLKNRPFSYCEVCGKRFTRRDALRRHERVQGHTAKGQDLTQQL